MCTNGWEEFLDSQHSGDPPHTLLLGRSAIVLRLSLGGLSQAGTAALMRMSAV